MVKKIIVEIISVAMILLFGYAAASKLNEHQQFILQIAQVIKIEHASEILSWVVPLVEFLACVLLIVPKWRKAGLYLAFILMLSFTGYITYFLLANSHLPCRCGGILNSMGWRTHLKFNIIFTLLAVTGILANRQQERKIAYNHL